MVRRKRETKPETDALSMTKTQPFSAAKPRDNAEAPSQKSARAAKKSSGRVRALLILRKVEE